VTLGETVPRFPDAAGESVFRPRPERRLSGRRAKAGSLLIGRVREGRGDEHGEVGWDGLVLDLEPLGRAVALLIVGLVVDPVAEENLLLTGQFHPGVLVRHRCKAKGQIPLLYYWKSLLTPCSFEDSVYSKTAAST
jgi:hypothetical protein